MINYVKRNENDTAFERPEGMSPALHELLQARGIASAEAAERFLHPDERSFHDPLLLSDMAPALAIIREALARGLPICVYGDYDVDGVCASAILLRYLKSQGGRAEVYLPSRHSEGYGLNEAAIRKIAGWARLLVTVDCGVTSVELVALATSLGLQVIVTDHHRPAEQLPDCPVVNPLLKDYPFPHLCGAGVAWKLVWALSGQMPTDLIDIAALATVADIVSLTGENRAIVALGLGAINRQPRPGIAALIESSGLQGKPITATHIAFQLAPRLNAGGRLDTAMRPFELIMGEEPARARALAEILEQENTQRRQVEQEILRGAEDQLRGFDFIRHRAIILAGKDWNPGVIGLAASRLVEEYHYPVILLSDQGEKLTGSCRSIEGVDIHAALVGCAETLVRFGGHRQAAGLTLLPERLPDFIEAMDRWLWENVPPEAYIPAEKYDTELDFEHVTPGLVAALEGLQPTGFGNPAPVFRARAEVLEARAVGLEGAHLKLTLAQEGRRLGGIAFRQGALAPRLSGEESRVDVLFVPRLNEYMGRVSAQAEVKRLRETAAEARLTANIQEESPLLCQFLTEILYNRKINLHDAQAPRWIDPEALRARLARSPQGSLVVVTEFDRARQLLSALPDSCPPDLYLGALPTDPRAFNAVCVCPPLGPLPSGYRHVTLWGAPEEWLSAPVPHDRLSGRPGWVDHLPDLEALRRVYGTLLDLSRRPLRFYTLDQLSHLVAATANVDKITALTATICNAEMGLFKIDLDATPPRLTRTSLKRADPEACPAWQTLQRWRAQELER